MRESICGLPGARERPCHHRPVLGLQGALGGL